MKRIVFTVLAIATLIISCTKENNQAVQSSYLPDSFTVNAAGVADDTKTGFSGANMVWTENDIIYVTTEGEIEAIGNHKTTKSFDYAIYKTTDNGSQTATFTKQSETGPIVASGKYVVLYSGLCDMPNEYVNGQVMFQKNLNTIFMLASVPVNQTYSSAGVAPFTMPMYGLGADLNTLSMKCLGSVLRFNFYSSTTKQVSKITLTYDGSSNLGAIAGAYGIKLDDTYAPSDPDVLYSTAPSKDIKYFGTWAYSTPNPKSSKSVVLTCPDVTLSTDSANPTQFNIVVSRCYSGVYNKEGINLNLRVDFSDASYTVLPLSKLPGIWLNNRIYNFAAKDL